MESSVAVAAHREAFTEEDERWLRIATGLLVRPAARCRIQVWDPEDGKVTPASDLSAREAMRLPAAVVAEHRSSIAMLDLDPPSEPLAPGSVPEDRQVAAWAASLLGVVLLTLRLLVEEWHADFHASGSLSIGVREHWLIGLGVYGLTAQVMTLTEAVLTLDEHNQNQATIPLIRPAIECALTADWIERGGYAEVLAIIREQTRQQRNAIDEFVRSGMPMEPEVDDRLAAELADAFRSDTAAAEKFADRCKEFEGGGRLYALYRVASHTSHANAAVIDLYMEKSRITEDAPFGLALRDTPKVENVDGWLGILLVMVVRTLSAWSRLDRRHTFGTRAKALARELEINYVPRMSPLGLAQQSKRQRELKLWRREQAMKKARAARNTPTDG